MTKPASGTEHWPDSWAPDRVHLSFTAVDGSANPGATAAVWILDLETKTASVFASVPSKFVSRSAFSPDGRWVAYSSDEAGGVAVFLQPFPATGNRYQIQSTGLQGNSTPWWSPSGKELFFNGGPVQWFVVSVATMRSIAFGSPSEIPRAGAIGGVGSRLGGNFSPRSSDAGPDAQHTLALVSEAGGQASGRQEIQVVLNWQEELKQRVPTK